MHYMLLIESESKRLLASSKIPVLAGWKAASAGELAACGLEFPAALKADVASGGRGKAGGVRRCESMTEALAAFDAIMQSRYCGETPRGVLIEPWLTAVRELYLAVTVDGSAGGFVVLYAPQGGIDVEFGPPPARYEVGPARNFRGHLLRRVLTRVEQDFVLRERVVLLAGRLLQFAAAQDCLTVEINPLMVLADGRLMCCDAKIVRDEAAAYRNAGIAAGLDLVHASESGLQRRCREARLTLVPLDGDIGLISSGAGMTMAAMDAIDAAGGRPACFLDCSGNPTPDGFSAAFDLLEQDARVRAILVSVFGGGMQTDRVARSLIGILPQKASRKPVVFRLNGTGGGRATALLQAAGYHNHESLEAAVISVLEKARAAA
jgi:succinyl-CoA synthetase beta subunit